MQGTREFPLRRALGMVLRKHNSQNLLMWWAAPEFSLRRRGHSPLLMALGRGGRSSNGRGHCPYRPPVPSSNWDRGTGDRRIVATALVAPKMAAPGGMRLALVHLVGLRNRLFAFLDVAEKTRDGNMISRIAGQPHHNLEVTGKRGDPRHRQPSLIMPAYVERRFVVTSACY
jgi:hypothetical protein